MKKCDGTGKDGTLFLSPVKILRYSVHTDLSLPSVCLCELNMYSGWINICLGRLLNYPQVADYQWACNDGHSLSSPPTFT